MLKHSNTGPLKVALLAISPHNRAILEFFFSGAGRNLFRVVQAAEAEAFILDYDHPDARNDWEKHAALHKPGIILSVHQADLPDCIWIPKPLTSRALTDAVERVHELVSRRQDAAAPVSPQPAVVAASMATASPSVAKPSEPPFRDKPQPFGISPRPVRQPLRSLVVSLPDEEDDEAEEALLNKPASSGVAGESPAVVFDPAETEIPLEEVDRPVEPSMPPEQAERRWKMLCGEQDDVQSMAGIASFTPENYLLNTLMEAMRVCRDAQQTVQIKFSAFDYVLLMPKQGLAYCTLDTRSDEFASLCNNPVQTGQVALHIPTGVELEQLEQHAANHAATQQDLEGFVWVSSLLTARGRLGRHVDAGRKISLKHWPNLTRLEQFPNTMRIAALWNQRPANPLEIAKALDVPQRYVFAFHTAANALNLFEMDQSKLKSREKEKPKENRGFFSRLLKRLLGGGAK